MTLAKSYKNGTKNYNIPFIQCICLCRSVIKITIKIVAENNKFALSQFLEAKGPKLRCQQCHIPPKPLRENPFLLLPTSSGCLATLGIPWFVHASLQSFQQIFEPDLVHVIPISYRTESERSQTGTFEVKVKILL